MNYKGYQCKIAGIKFPCPDGMAVNIVKPGSFKITPKKRNIETWPDGDGITHVVNYKKPQYYIQFTIKEHTAEEHDFIRSIFEETDSIEVEFYEDKLDRYLTGTFRMTDETSAIKYADEKEIHYDEMPISLEEH